MRDASVAIREGRSPFSCLATLARFSAQTPFSSVTLVAVNCKLDLSSLGVTSVIFLLLVPIPSDYPMYLGCIVCQWSAGKGAKANDRQGGGCTGVV